MIHRIEKHWLFYLGWPLFLTTSSIRFQKNYVKHSDLILVLKVSRFEFMAAKMFSPTQLVKWFMLYDLLIKKQQLTYL